MEVWRETDEDGVVWTLDRIATPNTWQLSTEELSEYPTTITLTRPQLIKLYHAMGDELIRTQLVIGVPPGVKVDG